MRSIVELDKVIVATDGVLVALDSILMQEESRLLSEAFIHIDRGLNVLCEARFIFRSEQKE